MVQWTVRSGTVPLESRRCSGRQKQETGLGEGGEPGAAHHKLESSRVEPSNRKTGLYWTKQRTGVRKGVVAVDEREAGLDQVCWTSEPSSFGSNSRVRPER